MLKMTTKQSGEYFFYQRRKKTVKKKHWKGLSILITSYDYSFLTFHCICISVKENKSAKFSISYRKMRQFQIEFLKPFHSDYDWLAVKRYSFNIFQM